MSLWDNPWRYPIGDYLLKKSWKPALTRYSWRDTTRKWSSAVIGISTGGGGYFHIPYWICLDNGKLLEETPQRRISSSRWKAWTAKKINRIHYQLDRCNGPDRATCPRCFVATSRDWYLTFHASCDSTLTNRCNGFHTHQQFSSFRQW